MYICLKCTQFLKINAGNPLSAPHKSCNIPVDVSPCTNPRPSTASGLDVDQVKSD